MRPADGRRTDAEVVPSNVRNGLLGSGAKGHARMRRRVRNDPDRGPAEEGAVVTYSRLSGRGKQQAGKPPGTVYRGARGAVHAKTSGPTIPTRAAGEI